MQRSGQQSGRIGCLGLRHRRVISGALHLSGSRITEILFRFAVANEVETLFVSQMNATRVNVIWCGIRTHDDHPISVFHFDPSPHTSSFSFLKATYPGSRSPSL